MSLTKTQVDDQINGVYGGLHAHDAAGTTQSIPNGTSYTKVTLFTDADPSSNMTVDVANDKLTLTKAGYYKIDSSVSFSGGTVNTNWFFSAFLGGVEQNNIHFERTIGTGGQIGAGSLSGIIAVDTVPVDLDMRVRHDGATQDLTLSYVNFSAIRVGV